MNKQNNRQDLNETVLTTAENLADHFLISAASSTVEEIFKVIPLGSLVSNLGKAYSNYKHTKEQKQLLVFINEAEKQSQGFLAKFFSNKSNSEIGFELLGVLDQTYLDKQARLLAILFKLFANNEITKSDFDKYAHIITQLNNYIFSWIEQDLRYFEERYSELPTGENDEISISIFRRCINDAIPAIKAIPLVIEVNNIKTRGFDIELKSELKRSEEYIFFYLKLYKYL